MKRWQASSGGAGDGELLQVIHEHLQADVVGQNGSAGLLRRKRNVTTGSTSTLKLKVKGQRLTCPQVYMLLWVWEGLTLESRKRAWKTSSGERDTQNSKRFNSLCVHVFNVYLYYETCVVSSQLILV